MSLSGAGRRGAINADFAEDPSNYNSENRLWWRQNKANELNGLWDTRGKRPFFADFAATRA